MLACLLLTCLGTGGERDLSDLVAPRPRRASVCYAGRTFDIREPLGISPAERLRFYEVTEPLAMKKLDLAVRRSQYTRELLEETERLAQEIAQRNSDRLRATEKSAWANVEKVRALGDAANRAVRGPWNSSSKSASSCPKKIAGAGCRFTLTSADVRH